MPQSCKSKSVKLRARKGNAGSANTNSQASPSIIQTAKYHRKFTTNVCSQVFGAAVRRATMHCKSIKKTRQLASQKTKGHARLARDPKSQLCSMKVQPSATHAPYEIHSKATFAASAKTLNVAQTLSKLRQTLMSFIVSSAHRSS